MLKKHFVWISLAVIVVCIFGYRFFNTSILKEELVNMDQSIVKSIDMAPFSNSVTIGLTNGNIFIVERNILVKRSRTRFLSYFREGRKIWFDKNFIIGENYLGVLKKVKIQKYLQ